MPLATVVIKKKYQRENYCKEELIVKLLREIEKNPEITNYGLRKSDVAFTQTKILAQYLQELQFCEAIVSLNKKYGTKGKSCYSITSKGEALALKIDLLLALLPTVWRAK